MKRAKLVTGAAVTRSSDQSVWKSTTVFASQVRAFELFSTDFDSWWPRNHHIGTSPMVTAVIEGWVGGRCYSTQETGADSPWGQILVWEPPKQLVLAWQIAANWTYEPDLTKSSDVEIQFLEIGGGRTRVDLQHRGFERMGPAGAGMKMAVDSPGGWAATLELFKIRCATPPA